MKREDFSIGEIPMMLLGDSSDRIFLYIHGLNGDGLGAIRFSNFAYKWQTLGIRLPKGEIRPEILTPQLQEILKFLKSRWKTIAIRANSFGAWLSLISFPNEKFDRCLFVSPLLNIESYILSKMARESITEDRLRREGTIDLESGLQISWNYLEFARKNPVHSISSKTRILHCTGDEVIPIDESKKFAAENNCELEIIDGQEHWFHTDFQLELLSAWESKNTQN